MFHVLRDKFFTLIHVTELLAVNVRVLIFRSTSNLSDFLLLGTTERRNGLIAFDVHEQFMKALDNC